MNVRTRSQMRKERPYNIRPPMTKGLAATFRIFVIMLVVSAEIPPVFVTPVFRRMFAVTLKVTLTRRSA